MKPFETNQCFTNPLASSTSPYLKQHAHNPVYWYPWGKEAIERARAENKPIHLSIGYSSCYWCHVMEREVFENLSIASLMNRMCINIKVDREEHPALDEIYMVARQVMTRQGGWPNTLFLTPELKPFYAGGTFAADESQAGRTSFPRLLEWLNFVWTTQEQEARSIADRVLEDMRPFLVHIPHDDVQVSDISARSGELYHALKKYHDERSGGFFQAPKFPHEAYLSFLLHYHSATGTQQALDIVTHSLQKMAAGGIYDQVGCGFHRYAVDKEWYVPHFEKMLYNQAQLARVYTDAARITASPYLADIAKGILEFVGGPLTSGNGTFYSAIDAETDGIEGAHYAWEADEFNAFLTPQEITLLTTFYALADIPHFPGHKKVKGQALILRKPLDEVARERNIPYLELSAVCAQVMNKLLLRRNTRAAPSLDDKAIVSWNGLMIDAFAHAGKVFNRPGYTARAREAADFLLENAIDNTGKLHHIYAGNRPQLDAVLEDYAFLAKGLITLWRVTPEESLLEAAQSLMESAEELFADEVRGYFSTQDVSDMLIRIKNCDDSATPNANAVMVENLINLYDITKEKHYLDKAESTVRFFLGAHVNLQVEHASFISAALKLEQVRDGKAIGVTPEMFINDTYALEAKNAPSDAVVASVAVFPADPKPGGTFELLLTLEIKDGWHINASKVNQPFLVPTGFDVQGNGVKLTKIDWPEPLRRPGQADNETLLVYEGLVNVTAHLKLSASSRRPPIKAMLRFQACTASTCYAQRDVVLSA